MKKPIEVILRKINIYLNENHAIFTVSITHDEYGAKFYITPANNWGCNIVSDLPLFNIPIMDYVYDRIEEEFNNEGYDVMWNNTRNIFRIKEDN